MSARAKVGQVSDLPQAAPPQPGRSKTRPTPPRDLAVRNAHPRLKIPRDALARVIAVLDQHAADFRGGCPAGELSLVFLTDPALAKIHADFMDDPTPTDVITFEGDPLAGLAGEVCVSVDTAWNYVGLTLVGRPARRQTPALHQAFATELTLYLVHGWLHLAGYDDLQPAKKRQMRAAEARAMKLLTAARAVPEFQFK